MASYTPMAGTDSPADSTQRLAPDNSAGAYPDYRYSAVEEANNGAAPDHNPNTAPAWLSSSAAAPKRKWYQMKRAIIPVALVALFLIIFLPILFTVIRKNENRSAAAGSSGGSGGGSNGGNGGTGKPGSTKPGAVQIGGDGSTVTLANGTEFTYKNPFGGFWVVDPSNPFNNNAQPNSWTPPLNTSWNWGVDRIYGVNLGGLFVIEPFITPDLFQGYPGTVDEYTLSLAMAADEANGGLKQLEAHYDTFITEQDIAEIAGAGLNFLRIPLAFWAIETWDSEPFLERTSWKYFLRVLGWARKYGLRVCLDLHAVPGSQNGFNHSGRLSFVSFMSGNMGLANAERTLYYLRVLTEFVSQPEYRDVVVMFGIVNEALISTIGMDVMTNFYLRAHQIIREVTGVGDGHGPFLAIGDGFRPLSDWEGFLQGSDRIALDQHPYFSFSDSTDTDPIDVIGPSGIAGGKWPLQACNTWGATTNQSRASFGVTIAGEFAASPNSCGLFLIGVGNTSPNPLCPTYIDYENYSETMKEGIKNFVMAQFDAFGDWFFWTWKIGASAESGKIESPGWSYQLGLAQGWIPTDPRTAFGICESLGASIVPWDGTFQGWQDGSTPSSIPQISSENFPWPPLTISNADVQVALLPTYTNTAPIITMPINPDSTLVFGTTTYPASVTASVDGWFNAQDTLLGVTTIAGCSYPDEYTASFDVIPTAACPDNGGVVPPVPVVPTMTTSSTDPLVPPVPTVALPTTTATTTATTTTDLGAVPVPTITPPPVRR